MTDEWAVDPSGPGEERFLQSAHLFLKQIYGYWRDLPRLNGANLPGRQQVDPVAIGNTLPWIWLADVIGQSPRFRYRLLGTAHIEAIGQDVTGAWIDEVLPAFRMSKSYEDLVGVVERGLPSYRRGATVMAFVNKRFERRERLGLPLARDGSQVGMLLGITVYEDVTLPGWAVRESQHAID